MVLWLVTALLMFFDWLHHCCFIVTGYTLCCIVTGYSTDPLLLLMLYCDWQFVKQLVLIVTGYTTFPLL